MDLIVDINIDCEANPFYGILRVLYANLGEIEREKREEKIQGSCRLMPTMENRKRKGRALANIIFIVLCLAILIFLLNAPKETTVKLPNDEQHSRFHALKNKKEAEKFCGECHSPNGRVPLSDKHPPKYRCLFCHKTR
jgi:hypothetical protein